MEKSPQSHFLASLVSTSKVLPYLQSEHFLKKRRKMIGVVDLDPRILRYPSPLFLSSDLSPASKPSIAVSSASPKFLESLSLWVAVFLDP